MDCILAVEWNFKKTQFTLKIPITLKNCKSSHHKHKNLPLVKVTIINATKQYNYTDLNRFFYIFNVRIISAAWIQIPGEKIKNHLVDEMRKCELPRMSSKKYCRTITDKPQPSQHLVLSSPKTDLRKNTGHKWQRHEGFRRRILRQRDNNR